MFDSGNFLRRALMLDASASGTMGVVMALAPGFVGRLLNLPIPLVLYIGIFFVAFALTLFVLARQARPAPALVWLIIIGNAGWALASIAILFTGLIAPNTLGVIVIAGQALAVALFAELEFIGQRRLTTVAA
jgi:hypothetical protein